MTQSSAVHLTDRTNERELNRSVGPLTWFKGILRLPPLAQFFSILHLESCHGESC